MNSSVARRISRERVVVVLVVEGVDAGRVVPHHHVRVHLDGAGYMTRNPSGAECVTLVSLLRRLETSA
jgi:hypothetical protein